MFCTKKDFSRERKLCVSMFMQNLMGKWIPFYFKALQLGLIWYEPWQRFTESVVHLQAFSYFICKMNRQKLEQFAVIGSCKRETGILVASYGWF